MPSGPKLHHHVPQFYLERFTSGGGEVRVRRRDGGAFSTGPRVVAAETGFYDVPDGLGGVSKEVEIGRSNIEGLTDDMSGACHRFIVGSPTNPRELDAQHLDRWRPVLRFNVAPAMETGADGEVRPMRGDVLHMWTPRSSRVGRPRRSDPE